MDLFALSELPAMLAVTPPLTGGARPLRLAAVNPSGPMELVAWLELLAMLAATLLPGGLVLLVTTVVTSLAGAVALSAVLVLPATAAAEAPTAPGTSLVFARATKEESYYTCYTLREIQK